MGLAAFLYRCPRCGRDPLTGEGDEVICPECGTTYRRGDEGGRIEVQDLDGSRRKVPARELASDLDREAVEAARTDDGSLRYRSAVVVRRLRDEEAVHFRGGLLGFAERLGDPEEGVLELEGRTLTLRPDRGPEERWKLLDLRAVQTSSRALQVVPVGGGMVQLAFVDDTPRRWEVLLHAALREAWRRAGRGEITEFQPRISAR